MFVNIPLPFIEDNVLVKWIKKGRRASKDGFPFMCPSGNGIYYSNAIISNTEDEDKQLEAIYEALPDKKKWEMMSKNWERVFNLSPLETELKLRGSSIQATFWELKKEQIRNVRFFEAASKRSESYE